MFRKWRKDHPLAPDEQGDIGEPTTAGWLSVGQAVTWLHASAPSRQVSYPMAAALSDELQGCAAYQADDHWHYVTYGLSDLDAPGSDVESQPPPWGFELTMRVPRKRGGPPEWPFGVLGELARRANAQVLNLHPGNRVDLRAPITGHPIIEGAPDTGLTVLAITLDPQLGRIATPAGVVTFLQMVGVTAEEKQDMASRSTASVLEEMAEANPLLITDPARAPAG